MPRDEEETVRSRGETSGSNKECQKAGSATEQGEVNHGVGASTTEHKGMASGEKENQCSFDKILGGNDPQSEWSNPELGGVEPKDLQLGKGVSGSSAP